MAKSIPEFSLASFVFLSPGTQPMRWCHLHPGCLPSELFLSENAFMTHSECVRDRSPRRCSTETDCHRKGRGPECRCRQPGCSRALLPVITTCPVVLVSICVRVPPWLLSVPTWTQAGRTRVDKGHERFVSRIHNIHALHQCHRPAHVTVTIKRKPASESTSSPMRERTQISTPGP